MGNKKKPQIQLSRGCPVPEEEEGAGDMGSPPFTHSIQVFAFKKVRARLRFRYKGVFP
jgi:hypothetical protein